MAKHQEKRYAHELYMHTELIQKDIAERVGVTEKTLCKWIGEEDWALQKAASTVTRKQQIVNYLMQLKELNDQIKGREQKWATPSESDTIAKITRAIQILEGEATLSDYIMVMEELTKFLNSVDQETTKKLLTHFNEFVQKKAKELSK